MLIALSGNVSTMSRSVNALCYLYNMDKHVLFNSQATHALINCPEPSLSVIERCEHIKNFIHLRQNMKHEYENITAVINFLSEESV